MSIIQETDNQQPSFSTKEEGSETILRRSTQEIVEAVNILPSKVEDEDIVHKNKAFFKYVEKANQMFNNKFDSSPT